MVAGLPPVRIPFAVTGNAISSVSVKPSDFLRIVSGRYLGQTVGRQGGMLGYDVVVQFPVPEANYQWLPGWSNWENWDDWRDWHGFGDLPPWSTFAVLPGLDGVGTTALTADMADFREHAFGVVYIVARRIWTTDGRPVAPGDYAGRVEVTVTADNR